MFRSRMSPELCGLYASCVASVKNLKWPGHACRTCRSNSSAYCRSGGILQVEVRGREPGCGVHSPVRQNEILKGKFLPQRLVVTLVGLPRSAGSEMVF